MNWLGLRFFMQTKPLKEETGIIGNGKRFKVKGIKWERLRPNAMKLIAPYNSISIDLNDEEQKILKNLILLQQ